MDRGLLLSATAYCALVAGLLLLAPRAFYAVVPGLSASGPVNLHLLRDVGIAYAVLAASLATAFGDISRARFAATQAALYLVAHAALHAALEASARDVSRALQEAPGVYVPAVFASALALRLQCGRAKRIR